eukprot:936409-Pleurochrysis_carterae.AAC.6
MQSCGKRRALCHGKLRVLNLVRHGTQRNAALAAADRSTGCTPPVEQLPPPPLLPASCEFVSFKARNSEEEAPLVSGKKGALNSDGASAGEARKESDPIDVDPAAGDLANLTAGDLDGLGLRPLASGTSRSEEDAKPSRGSSPVSRKVWEVSQWSENEETQ